MPGVTGWRAIDYWEAMGLLVLSKILFRGFRVRTGWGGHWRARMQERWAQMTPEEREKFREGMRAPLRIVPASEARAAARLIRGRDRPIVDSTRQIPSQRTAHA